MPTTTESKPHAAGEAATPTTQWWPDLYLRRGHELQAITPEQAAELMELYRDGRGSSEMQKPWIDLHDIDGNRIGFVSYNGRVWIGHPNKTSSQGNREIPVGERETAAQREQEGWK